MRPALDDPATARLLKRYRWQARGLLLLGPLLLVAFVVAAASHESTAEELQRIGKQTRGQVLSYSEGWIDGGLEVQYAVGGRTYRQRIQLNDSSPRYQVGQSVAVIYDPRDPTRIRTASETNQAAGAVWATIALLTAGVIFLVGGIVAVRRGRRWSRLLAEAEWEPQEFVHERGRQRDRYTLDDGRVLDGGASWRFFLPSPRRGTLWVARADDGRSVAATPGPGRFIAVTQRPDPPESAAA